MSTFFRRLRRTNKIYPTPNQFVNIDALTLNPPTGFGNAFSAPSTVNLGNNRYRPGYVVNNQFVPASDVSRVMRNNDLGGLRTLFPNANNNQLNNLGSLRRADNIPDSSLHSLNARKRSVKQSHPETAVRDPAGVTNALQQNPRLYNYFRNVGTLVLIGTGIYLTVNFATLISDIVAALNRTGGSFFYTGVNGGTPLTNVESCMLRYRSCGINVAEIPETISICSADFLNPTATVQELQAICSGHSTETEGSVCRESDPNADPDSRQYVDVDHLDVGQMVACVEPYDLGDLIGDLGLDHLLGEEGILTKSSESGKSASQSLLPILLALGGLLLLIFIGYIILKSGVFKGGSSAGGEAGEVRPIIINTRAV